MILRHSNGLCRPRHHVDRSHTRPWALVRSARCNASAKQQLLDSFWEARGVLDPTHRKRLVDAAEALDAEALHPLDTAPLAPDVPLPGLPATWQLEQSASEVISASRRLLALQQMLGGGLSGADGGSAPAGPSSAGSFGGFAAGGPAGPRGAGGGRGIDVVWMVVREPRLLSADLAQITGRLLEMKVATYGRTNVDVLKLIESQPSLLLSDRWRLDLEALQAAGKEGPSPAPNSGVSGGSREARAPASSARAAADDIARGAATGSNPDSFPGGALRRSHAADSESAAAASSSPPSTSYDAVEQLVQAWKYGVASDGDREWAMRLSQLAGYRERHGDTCVGFRDGDDADLARWATKQRADLRRGELAPARLEQLTALGFLFDADEAEWCRWFSELLAFKRDTGHASPMPLVTGCDMYLINWCSVQRIARRSRVLSESRIQRLDDAGFDWTGADPLS